MNIKGKWTDETLEHAINVGQSETLFKKVSKHLRIPFTCTSNHTNGKTQSRKCGPINVVTKKKIML
jgi:hypothetical protein